MYKVDESDRRYNELVTDVGTPSTWCTSIKSIKVRVTATADVSGKTVTADYCAVAVEDLVACPHESSPEMQILHDARSNNTHNNSTQKRSEIQRRSPVNTKSGNAPEAYLSNFEGNTPPGPITHAPNTHYYTVTGTGDSASANPYSVLFDGNRGIPVMVGFKVSHANMGQIDLSTKMLRNKWTKLGMIYN